MPFLGPITPSSSTLPPVSTKSIPEDVVSQQALQDRVALLEGIVQKIIETEQHKHLSLPSPGLSEEEETKDESGQIAEKILSILGSYGHFTQLDKGATVWGGKDNMLLQVEAFVRQGVPVQMVLPAFPFKSPNRGGKVLGSLPDLGEEFALAHLQSLCDNIQAVYQPGGEVYIASDGLVYNDLLGIPDGDVFDYGNALRHLAATKGFTGIKFKRLTDLIEISHGLDEDQLRDHYLTHASCWRRELVTRYTDPTFDARQQIKENPDTCMTFRGYVKFLNLDLQKRLAANPESAGNVATGKKQQKQIIEQTARQMLARGQVFASAIRARFSDFLRLSIHPSTGETKIPVSLNPQPNGDFGRTPWHSCLAVNLDATTTTVHAEDVAATHDLVYRNGQPYYYREKSEVWDWGPLAVDFEPLYPCGLLIRPQKHDGPGESHQPPSLNDIPMRKLRKLSNFFSPVVCRGFAETTEETIYQDKAHEMGEVQEWSFGIVQKVKDAGRSDKMGNNVTSNEAMPMHYDGMFKFKTIEDAQGNKTEVQDPPAYQYFTCLAAAPKGDGYTLFASAPRLFKFLPAPYTVERLQKVKWSMDNDGYWARNVNGLPLVVSHPETGIPCVRFHDPWDSSQTKFSTCKVTIDNDEQAIIQVVQSLLYDHRVCLRFSWEVGDILVSDNYTMLHTRTAFESTVDRELWRIHVN